jgi:hypothetical protein
LNDKLEGKVEDQIVRYWPTRKGLFQGKEGQFWFLYDDIKMRR